MKARDLFTTIRTEGSLLPADLLQRLVNRDKDLSGLDDASYHLVARERLNERISQSWQRLLGAWIAFRATADALPELHPDLNTDAATFDLTTAGGHERKTTGSYCTPASLIRCLLDSALDSVLDGAVRKPNAEEAILALKVCDPACGSGHFHSAFPWLVRYDCPVCKRSELFVFNRIEGSQVTYIAMETGQAQSPALSGLAWIDARVCRDTTGGSQGGSRGWRGCTGACGPTRTTICH